MEGVDAMTYENDRAAGAEHRIALDGREHLTVTGVEDVESFDEYTVVTSTALGRLVVRGSGLHIEQLSLDGGQLRVEGSVDSVSYEDDGGGRGGLLSRLFG